MLVTGISTRLAAIAGAVLLALFLVNVAQIATRPITGGWIWVNDLSRLLVTWVIMIGASAAIGLREHLLVDFVVQRAPAAFRTVSALVVRALEVGIGFILLVSGAAVAMNRMDIQYIQLGIPTGYAYLAVPVLGFFMVLFGVLMSLQGQQPTDVAEGGEAK
ncbi:TRAP transporter small permease subunit [Georgenia wutianyii]|uniref:TRAP transporter small permease subunit n=1 Tax=Georgenia wutianyii TaxID=2585135 RepID=A0ABX5VKH7_9MICO|nr:TRAP transporter small permease subunit [Georgenia wutianyii]QDB78343.1 TRAP transporter small permease subunit [Georgenia wutianyii]